MAMIKCPECGNDISDKAKICPKCGYKQRRKTNLQIIAIGGIILGGILIVLSLVLWFLNHQSSSDHLLSEEQTSEKNEDDKERKKTVDKSSEDSVETSEMIAEGEFVGTEDLYVIAAFIYDNHLYIAVRNESDKPIIDFSVAYTLFDKNGFSTTTEENGYEQTSVEAANIMPGEYYIGTWSCSENSKYAEATVENISFFGGSSWEAQNIKTWANDTRKSFTVDKHNANVAALSNDAKKAVKNEYAKLSHEKIAYTNQFSSSGDYQFWVINTGEKGIAKIYIYILQFDKDGFAVPVSPYDMFCKNGRLSGGTINLAAGKSDEFSDSLFFDASTYRFLSVISKIEFSDGDEWENPYLIEWILTNSLGH